MKLYRWGACDAVAAVKARHFLIQIRIFVCGIVWPLVVKMLAAAALIIGIILCHCHRDNLTLALVIIYTRIGE